MVSLEEETLGSFPTTRKNSAIPFPSQQLGLVGLAFDLPRIEHGQESQSPWPLALEAAAADARASAPRLHDAQNPKTACGEARQRLAPRGNVGKLLARRLEVKAVS